MNYKEMKIGWIFAVDLVIILSMVLSNATVVTAASTSPFVGRWSTIDVDGSDIRLSIAQTGSGKFKITWTESYISFCDGGPGLVQGTGWLNAEDPLLLEVDLHLKCFTTGAELDIFHVLRYHQNTGMLSSKYDGSLFIWSKSGRRYPPVPRLDLRVNYGDNWVESFYEAGHTVWVMVTDGDGAVKATAELMTEPKDFWNGESGFQTYDSVWYDGSGNPMGTAPDIQPYDWVYGWVDNGAASKVQIGDIRGVVDITTDSVQGTIQAPWFSSEVVVECHPWGAPGPEILKYDDVLADGNETYSCSWTGEWDIQSGDPVGVSYFGPDGHWVANVLRNPRFTVFPEWEWLEGWEWQDGSTITATVDGKPACIAEGTAGYLSDNPWSTFVDMKFPEGCDVAAGDVVSLSDGTTSLSHTIENLTITGIDETENIVTGTAEVGALVHTWVHGYGEIEFQLIAEDGTWSADYDDFGFDLVDGMCGRAEIRDETGNATAEDWCIPNPVFTVHPDSDYIEGWQFDVAVNVHMTIDDPITPESPDIIKDSVATPTTWDPNTTLVTFNLSGEYDLKPGDLVTLDNGLDTRSHVVREIAITSVDKDAETVSGTAEAGAWIYAWVHGYGGSELQLPEDGGNWMADFTSIGFDLQEGMAGRAEIRDEQGNSTAADWYIPRPHFTIFPEWEWFDGMEWPDTATVDITVTGKSECTTQKTDISGGFFNGGFPEPCDVAAGDVVTFTAGDIIRTHTVENLAATEVNKISDIVAGTADSGKTVHAWIHESPDSDLYLPVSDGAWTADFGALGFDLIELMSGRVEVADEFGNATAVDWWIPNPTFVIFPEWDWFDGSDWPDGSGVEISVEDKPECIAWKNEILDNFFNGGFPETCDIVVGDTLTFTDGETTRIHTVDFLEITSVDAAADTVSGLSNPIAHLVVWPYDYNNAGVETDADGSGNWAVTFGVDIQDGMAGRVYQYDEQGNATAVEWTAPVTIFVTSTVDVLADDGVCTLREAVIAANTNSPSGSSEGECPAGRDVTTDTIVLAADQIYSLTMDNTYEDGALDGDLDFWDNSAPLDLILKAEGGLATISQDAAVDDRVMDNLWAAVVLEQLFLTGGNSGAGGGISIPGGNVTLINSVVTGNSASWGGGIIVEGASLTLDGSIVSDCIAANDGGGIFMRFFDAGGTIDPVPAVVNIIGGSQILNNSAEWGGGISSWNSTLNINGSDIASNSATNSGGGILVHEGGDVTIENGSTIHVNSAQWGAGISNWDANVTITGSILSSNAALGVGGGLENGGALTVTDSAFLGNTAVDGGGAVWSFAADPNFTTVTNSCIVGNSSTAVVSITGIWQIFTQNWWGNPTGPGGFGGGLGDTIDASIVFMPFLIEPPAICATP